MENKKLLLTVSASILGSFGLFSCSNKEDENQLIGGQPAKCIGIESCLYTYGKEGKFEPLPRYNFGESNTEEKTVYLFKVTQNVDYLLIISPILTGGSIPMLITGDSVTISKNDDYEVSFCEDYDESSYNVKFLKEGEYQLDISFLNFTDKIKVEVVS